MPERGKVLVVRSDRDEREALGAALEDAGFEVLMCPGPTAPDYRCIGDREGYCPLVERADVVVLDPWLEGDEQGIGTTSDVLLELYVGRGRSVVFLGSTGSLDQLASGHVIRLGERPAASDVVAAVRSAPDADGFVLRG